MTNQTDEITDKISEITALANELKKLSEDATLDPETKFDKMAAILEKLEALT